MFACGRLSYARGTAAHRLRGERGVESIQVQGFETAAREHRALVGRCLCACLVMWCVYVMCGVVLVCAFSFVKVSGGF